MGNDVAEQTYREVMTVDPPAVTTPLALATRDFVFGEVWCRPGLSRRERRWVTLACVAAADSPQPIEDHVYAALNSGDIELEAMLEFVLQFAVLLRLAEGVARRDAHPAAVGPGPRGAR